MGSQTQWDPVDLFAPILYRAVQLSGPACEAVFPPLKAPRGATPQQKAAVKEARKYHNLCTIATEELALLRAHLDETPGGGQRLLLHAVDGDYAKKSFLTHLPARTSVVFRLRKDARLHAYLPPLSRTTKKKTNWALGRLKCGIANQCHELRL